MCDLLKQYLLSAPSAVFAALCPSVHHPLVLLHTVERVVPPGNAELDLDVVAAAAAAAAVTVVDRVVGVLVVFEDQIDDVRQRTCGSKEKA